MGKKLARLGTSLGVAVLVQLRLLQNVLQKLMKADVTVQVHVEPRSVTVKSRGTGGGEGGGIITHPPQESDSVAR